MNVRTLTFSAIAMAFAMFFAFVVPARSADQLCFSWSYDDSTIAGFRMLKDSHENVVLDNIAPDLRSVCVPDPKDLGNHAYFMVAVGPNGEISSNSDIAVVKQVVNDPPAIEQPPATVGGFVVTVKVEPVQ